jgi:hypothetical protein
MDPPHVDRRLAVQASHFVIFGNSKDLAKIRQVKDRDCRFPRSNARKNRVRMANLAAKSGLSF